MEVGFAISMVLFRICDRPYRLRTSGGTTWQDLWTNGLGLVGGDGNDCDRDGIAIIGSNIFAVAEFWQLGNIQKFAKGIAIAINWFILWVRRVTLQYTRIGDAFGLGFRLRKFIGWY